MIKESKIKGRFHGGGGDMNEQKNGGKNMKKMIKREKKGKKEEKGEMKETRLVFSHK
jgi:hypothetical protein